MSFRERLFAKHRGKEAEIEDALEGLVDAMERGGISPELVWLDNEGVKAEPEDVKAFVDERWKTGDLEHLLILGSGDIVPFFSVPNPVLDYDDFVLTDNPYASSDDEILVPERSVGRIPDGTPDDGDCFVEILEWTARHHCVTLRRSGTFGCSAAVWKEASLSVMKAMGAREGLRLSPPLTRDKIESEWISLKSRHYFNLHGSMDTPYFYGQGDGYYPVALSPSDVGKGDVSGAVVVSEACYGAYIDGRGKGTSIPISYLSRGALAFVGSTTIAYGPAFPPCGEADLMAIFFFHYLDFGAPMGIALALAKAYFARKMIEEQGYLDEDDRKTLLQFILLGDPSLKKGGEEVMV